MNPGSLGIPVAVNRPADFSLCYAYDNGSLPPPYHYEYTIRLSPGGEVELTYQPDYPAPATPVWHETFAAGYTVLADLYACTVRLFITRKRWKLRRPGFTGGSSHILQVSSGGQTYNLSASLEPAEIERLAPLLAAVRALVPQDAWERLSARREDYESRAQ